MDVTRQVVLFSYKSIRTMPAHIRPLKIIVAPDSMKGVLGAPEAAGAIATGARKALDTLFSEKNTSVRIMPIADGGEGTAETLGVAYGAEKSRPIPSRRFSLLCGPHTIFSIGPTITVARRRLSIWRQPPDSLWWSHPGGILSTLPLLAPEC